MATRTLSPKRALERLQQHRQCVSALAMQHAKKIIQTNIRAKGQRVSDFSAREIALLAQDYLAQHRAELIAEAKHIVATSPYFERWRLPDCANLSSAAQRARSHKSMTSVVQMSGAK